MTSQTPWTRIFVSYARTDAVLLESRLRSLDEQGVIVLRDTRDILPTEAWRARLVALIGEADAIVCVVSPRFAASEVCAWEVQTASQLHKRLVPVLLEPTEATSLPEAVSDLNWLSWLPQVSDKEAAVALVAALSLDVAWVREHTRLGTLATHWDANHRADAGLLRGTALIGAESWLASRPSSAPSPTRLQQQFISASRAGDLTRRRRNLWIACGVALLSAGLGTWAVWSSIAANRNLRIAESRRYAALSNQALSEGYPQRAALLAAHALQVPEVQDGQVTDAYKAARKVLGNASGAVWLSLPGTGSAMSPMRAGRLIVATYAPQGGRWSASLTVAEAAVDGRIGRVVCTVALGDQAVTQVSLSSDGRRATAMDDHRIVQVVIDGENCTRTLDLPHDFGMSWKAVFDPLGRWVVLADHVFRGAELIELHTGGSRHALGRLAGRVAAMALSADGSVLAAASDFDGRGRGKPGDALAVAWHLRSGGAPARQELLTIGSSALPAPASALAVSMSSRAVNVLIGRIDGTLTLAQFESPLNEVVKRESGGQRAVISHFGTPGDPRLVTLAVSDIDQRFWLGRGDGHVSRLQLVGLPRAIVEGPRSRVSNRTIRRLLPWSDGRGVAVAARDGEGWAPDLQWCSTSSMAGPLSCRPLTGHEGGMIDLTAISGSNLLLSLSQDRSLRVWNPGLHTASLAGEQWQVSKGGRIVEGAGGQHWFIVGGDGSRPDVLPLATPATHPAPPPAGRTVAMTPDGAWRVYVADRRLQLHLVAASAAAEVVPVPIPGDQDLVAISPDGHSLAVLRQDDGVLSVWRRGHAAGRSVHLPKKPYSHLVWSPQADALAIAEMQGLLWLWKDPVGGDTAPVQVTGGIGDHRGLAWHPSGRWLAAAGFEAALSIWDAECALQTPGCSPRRIRVGAQLRAPVFSPDGRWLACGVTDGGIPVWRISAAGVQEPPLLLQGHDGDVAAVSFSADSRKLASASFSWTSSDNSVRVWDLEAQDPARAVDEVARGTDWFTDVRLDRRLESVVVVTQDGQLRRYPLSGSELVRRARAMAGRDWSEFEKGAFFPSER